MFLLPFFVIPGFCLKADSDFDSGLIWVSLQVCKHFSISTEIMGRCLKQETIKYYLYQVCLLYTTN